MSSGTMVVRLPDGTFRFGIYYGTAGIALPSLHDTQDQAWDCKRGGECGCDPYGYEEGAGDPVVAWTNYGGGWWWEATATRNHLTSGHHPDGEPGGYSRPDIPPLPQTEGWPPDWPPVDEVFA